MSLGCRVWGAGFGGLGLVWLRLYCLGTGSWIRVCHSRPSPTKPRMVRPSNGESSAEENGSLNGHWAFT